MKIALLVIGDELLCGEIADKNVSILASLLQKSGHQLKEVVFCKDLEIKASLERLISEMDLVITSGGLGCTHDDVTRKAVAELLGSDLFVNEEIKRDLEERFFGEGFICHLYATMPKGMVAFPSKKYLAPALFSKERGLLVLPGVPHEFQLHLEENLKNILPKNELGLFSRKVNFLGVREEDARELLSKLHESNPEFEIGSYPSTKKLSVVFRKEAKSQIEFDQSVLPLIDQLISAYPTKVFPSVNGLIEEALHEYLLQSGKTLALAESCTGGAMALRLTKLPGASKYFFGSMVTYASAAKTSILGVLETTLLEHSEVSMEVAKEMAQGLIREFSIDIAIAVTGIAGPDGGSEEKPVGTSFGAIALKGEKIYVGKLPLRENMSRNLNIEASSTYLLGELYQKLVFGKAPFQD